MPCGRATGGSPVICDKQVRDPGRSPDTRRKPPAQAGGSSWRDEEQSRRGRFADGSVNPGNTIQMCSRCVMIVKKALSDRARSCPRCGPVLDRDQNRGTPSSFSVC
ncbi:MAG: zinc ribbon domain-containing protein [Candidatus Methanoculleus thermohydrogenotrophicum]